MHVANDTVDAIVISAIQTTVLGHAAAGNLDIATSGN